MAAAETRAPEDTRLARQGAGNNRLRSQHVGILVMGWGRCAGDRIFGDRWNGRSAEDLRGLIRHLAVEGDGARAVGRGTRFVLRSPVAKPRANVEMPILRTARAAHVNVTWLRDSATGNSDHRELALARAPATKLGVADEPFRHTAKDTPDRLQRGAFARVLRVVWPLLREVS